MSAADEEIAKLKNSWKDAFKAICDKRCEMEWLNRHAVEVLKANVDSVMSASELGAMLSSFDEKRFGSTLAKNFLKTICNRAFPNDAKWRKTVECVDIDGQYSCRSQEIVCDISSITVNFVDNASDRAFKLVVPVKENVWIDFARYPSEPGMGKYVLMCTKNRKSKDILESIHNQYVIVAIVTKASNIKDAIDNFMLGKYDSELADASAIDFTYFKPYLVNRFSYTDDEGISLTDELFKSIDAYQWREFDDSLVEDSYKYIKSLIVD